MHHAPPPDDRRRKRNPIRTGTRIAVIAAALAAILGAATLTANAASSTMQAQVAATAGCGTSPTLTDGTHTIQSSGQARSFILDVPDGYDPDRPYRLVFGFHWLGGSAEDVATGQTVGSSWAYYGLKALADDSAIFVAPQGIDAGWANEGGRDVAFVDDMMALIEGDLCVDTTQRFSLGFSYGGSMSYSLACSRADRFRAIAAYSSPGLISGCDGGTDPMAVFAAHGTTDQFSDGIAQRDRFAANNSCTPQDTPEPQAGSRTHITTVFSGCAAGYPLVWASFDEGHTPAPRDGAAGSGTDTWLPGETWDFFTQFASEPPDDGTTPPDDGTTPPDDETSGPPPGGSGCTAEITVVNDWGSGWQGDVLVTAGDSDISGWTLTWTWPSGQRISSSWNADVAASGSGVTATDVGWNGSVQAGDTSNAWGFIGTGSAASPAVACTAN